VSQGILDLIPATTRVIVSRKYKGRAQAAQEELQNWMAEEVRKGNHVARLKGGDPFMYGRGGEEIEAMQKLGVTVRVVPGLSSVLCAPLAAGISVTSRGVADRVVVLSGHCKAKDVAGADKLAVDSVVCCSGNSDGSSKNKTLQVSKLKIPVYDAGTTVVFLMAIATLQHVQRQLIVDAGFPESCPVAIIERASTPNQRVTRTTVGKLLADATNRAVASPATVVVGRAVNAHTLSHKFEGGAAYFGRD
jgi:siroheme synthase